MSHKEFCLWLEGFFARGGEAPTAEQWSMIGKLLQMANTPVRHFTERKAVLDECEQGDRKPGGFVRYIPPFTPQEPFAEQGY